MWVPKVPESLLGWGKAGSHVASWSGGGSPAQNRGVLGTGLCRAAFGSKKFGPFLSWEMLGVLSCQSRPGKFSCIIVFKRVIKTNEKKTTQQK